MKTETGSRNEPSAAAILNFVFTEYLSCGSKCLRQISYIGRKWNSGSRLDSQYSCKFQDGGRRPS